MKGKIVGFIIVALMILSVLSVNSTLVSYDAKSIDTLTKGCEVSLGFIYGVDVSCDENQMTVYPNETAVYGIHITNTGDVFDTYVLDCPDLIDCCYWSSLTSYELTLFPGESDIVVLSVTPYMEEKETYTITVRATSTSDPTVNDSVPTYTTVILGDRTIDVATNKAVYKIGETVLMSLTNIGDETIEGNPTFEVFDENNTLVFGCYPDCWIPLQPGENFTCQWSSDVPEGKYTVEGWFLTDYGTYFDNASFFILNDDSLGPPYGPTLGVVGNNYTFCIELPDDPECEPYHIMWDWGDGTYSEWLGPYVVGEIVCVNQSWDEPGDYEIRVKIKDGCGNESWLDPLIITIVDITELEIEFRGGLGLTAIIRNIGNEIAYDVNFSIDIMVEGIIFGFFDTHFDGTQNMLPSGAEIVEKLSSRIIIGFGQLEITAVLSAFNAEGVSVTLKAFIFFIFVFLH